MSAKRRSFVGPLGAWSASPCAGAFVGMVTKAAANTTLRHNNRLRCKGMGFINDAPEDGFLVGTMDPLHGRLVRGNRFAVAPYCVCPGMDWVTSPAAR